MLLPYHPGGDQRQQQVMLSGKVPPPGPAELRLRPLDVSALIDAAAIGKLVLTPGLRTEQVVVLGQSWGGTTALQLAGVRPSSARLQKRCSDLNDPSRKLSWVLPCSFMTSADQAGLADRRVKAVVAAGSRQRHRGDRPRQQFRTQHNLSHGSWTSTPISTSPLCWTLLP